jgi:hypothetical protein
MRTIVAALVICLLGSAWAFGQETEPTLEEIQQQIKELQEQMREMMELYQGRIELLEEQIRQLEQRREAVEEEDADASPDVPGGEVPATPSAPRSVSLMNPAISVIPDFTYSMGNDPAWEEADPFQVREVEVAFSASIDPIASASVYLALEDGELDAEEAFAVFPGVPGGFTVKLGKFKMDFGKQNTLHTHSWFQANQPLALRTMLGGEGLADVGLSVNRLVPTPWFSDVTIEVAGGGNEEVFSGSRSDLSYLGAWRNFWDLSDNANLEAQLSLVTGRNVTGHSTGLGNVAVTYRYKPLASATRASFLWRTELLLERYQGADVPEGGFDDGFEGVIGLQRSTGAFSYVDWQFTRGWFVGARADYAEHPWEPSKHDTGGALTLTWFPSEFQRLRLQAERIDYDEVGPRSALVFEYIFAIGAHGAHPF